MSLNNDFPPKIAYPSEPVLALASRHYMHTSKQAFLPASFRLLKEYFASGAVLKGHRGELIVRLLNILAIDNCMMIPSQGPESVREVPLLEFLAQFDRESAKVSEIVSVQAPLKSELSTTAEDTNDPTRWGGHVCFTHFVHLARSMDDRPLITPDLLRYAYRRTAAIVVDDGRRGIDWIIPVRLDGDDKFVGLCGQDKNRVDDTLAKLVQVSNAETHNKLTPTFFLSDTERQLFKDAGWSLDWPTILFSIHARDAGAALAEAYEIKTRSNRMISSRFPCIVLTGLGYEKIIGKNKEAEKALCELRNQLEEAPPVYKQNVPMTYGMKSKQVS